MNGRHADTVTVLSVAKICFVQSAFKFDAITIQYKGTISSVKIL